MTFTVLKDGTEYKYESMWGITPGLSQCLFYKINGGETIQSRIYDGRGELDFIASAVGNDVLLECDCAYTLEQVRKYIEFYKSLHGSQANISLSR